MVRKTRLLSERKRRLFIEIHDFQTYTGKSGDVFDNSLILTRIFKERFSCGGLDWRVQKPGRETSIEKMMRGNEAESNYTNVLTLRWQEEEEHSWSSAKAIFVMRFNSLPCILRLPFVDICKSGTRYGYLCLRFHLQSSSVKDPIFVSGLVTLLRAVNRSVKSISSGKTHDYSDYSGVNDYW